MWRKLPKLSPCSRCTSHDHRDLAKMVESPVGRLQSQTSRSRRVCGLFWALCLFTAAEHLLFKIVFSWTEYIFDIFSLAFIYIVVDIAFNCILRDTVMQCFFPLFYYIIIMLPPWGPNGWVVAERQRGGALVQKVFPFKKNDRWNVAVNSRYIPSGPKGPKYSAKW